MSGIAPWDFSTRLKYGQERLRREDQLISVHTNFRPDPRAVSLTWKFYARYRDRCDLCRQPGSTGASSPEADDGNNNYAQQNGENDGCCGIGSSEEAGANKKSPMDKLPEYMDAVKHAIQDGPHEKFGELPQPPLTSHDYGWWPANTFDESHDEADAERFNHRLKRPNYWY